MLNEKQIANRAKGIGASEAATVLGLNPNMSPYQLWRIKTGKDESPDLSDIPCVYWGTIHEEPIAQHYAKVMGVKVRRDNETRFHVEHKFMLCHLDRKIVGMSKVLECKFAMFAKDQWGESGTDEVPLSYIVQVQYQLAVTGYQEADLAVLIGGHDFRVYHFQRDEELIQKITEEVCKFWKLVESDTPADLRDRTDAAIAYPTSNGTFKDAETDVVDVINEFKEVRAMAKQLDDKRKQLSDNLTLFIKDADGIAIGQDVIATWKPTKRGNRVLKVME